MPYSMITVHEEMRIFLRIVDFYSNLYPKIQFSKAEKMLKPKEIGNVLYTYAGDEAEPLAGERMAEIESELYRHLVPAILLKKAGSYIVLDGHRRLRVAWKNKLSWKALVIIPGKRAKFTIEEAVIGKLKDLY